MDLIIKVYNQYFRNVDSQRWKYVGYQYWYNVGNWYCTNAVHRYQFLLGSVNLNSRQRLPSSAQHLTEANGDTGLIKIADSWLPRFGQYCSVLSASAIRSPKQQLTIGPTSIQSWIPTSDCRRTVKMITMYCVGTTPVSNVKHRKNIYFTRVVVTLALLGHQTSHSQNKFFFP